MRKVLMAFLIVFILAIGGCIEDNTETESLLERLKEHRENIVHAIEAQQSLNAPLKIKNNNLSTQDYSKLAYEDLMDTYNQMELGLNDVKLDEFLLEYKELLDDSIKQMEADQIDGVLAFLTVSFGDNIDLDVTISLTTDRGVLAKFNLPAFDTFLSVKFGYEDQNFFIRELFEIESPQYYEYYEFLENNYMVNIRYAFDNWWYRYQNQVDNTYYERYKTFPDQNETSGLNWYNPETNIRIRLIEGGQNDVASFELFNDKTTVFSFGKSLNKNQIIARWQLLEAQGWDYALATTSGSGKDVGVYKGNDEKIFGDEVMQFNFDYTPGQYSNALVSVAYSLDSFPTQADLDLTRWGLTFNYDITLEFIHDTLDSAHEQSKALALYRGIDFLNDDLREKLYDQIDPYLKK